MTDDLAAKWDDLKDDMPGDHASAAEAMYDLCDKMADRIEALQAKRCAEVKPLEWVPDEEFGKGYLKADTAFGVVRCIPEDVPKFTARHVETVMHFINLRPASEVRAEAHAAAVEAAADAISILPENGNAGPPQDGVDRLLDAQRRQDAKAIRALHTDASLAALAKIKREAREEALREAVAACNSEHLEDATGTECDTAYTLAVSDCIAAITALIEKDKDDE